jgi:ABC-type Fe3+-citrate transport system substrate-binding protein
MDFDNQEAKLIKAEQESLKRIQRIRLLRIQNALLHANIDDAELIAATMSDRTEADQKIAEFKKTYVDTPHG